MLHVNAKVYHRSGEFDSSLGLRAQFFARLKTFLPTEKLGWSLTRQGRYQLRKKVAGHLAPEGSVYNYENATLKHNDAALSMKQRLMEVAQFMAVSLEPRTDGCVREQTALVDCEEETEAEQEEVFPDRTDRTSISAGLFDERVGETMEGIGEQRRLKSKLDSMEQMSVMQMLDFDIMTDAHSRALDVIKRYFVSLHKDRPWQEGEYGRPFCPFPRTQPTLTTDHPWRAYLLHQTHLISHERSD